MISAPSSRMTKVLLWAAIALVALVLVIAIVAF